MTYLGYLTTEIMSALLTYYMMSCFFYKKEHQSYTWFKVGIIAFIANAFKMPLQSMYVNMIVTCLAILVVGRWFFKGRFYNIVLVGALYFSFLIQTDWLIGYTISLFVNQGSITNSYILDQHWLIIFTTLFHSIFVYIIIRLVFDRKKKRLNRSIHIYQSLLAVLNTILMISYLFKAEQTVRNIILDYSIIIFGVTTVSYYLSFERQIIVSEENHKNTMLFESLKNKEEHYQLLEKHHAEIRGIKHDLKNQLLRIKAYIIQEKQKQAIYEINQLNEEIEISSNHIYTNHIAINILLNNKTEIMHKNDILFDFMIRVPKYLDIDERDLITLLGNLIDNSIEGSLKCIENRHINLVIVYYEKALIVEITNTTHQKITSFETTKNKKNHGIGMNHIQNIVSKYHGNLNHESMNDKLKITINLWDNKDT